MNSTSGPEKETLDYILTRTSPQVSEYIKSIEWKTYFQYKPDPIINSFSPYATIKSGNTTITVKGDHIDSVAVPIISMIKENIKSTDRCRVLRNGSEMLCQSPKLNEGWGEPKILSPVRVILMFKMDGIIVTDKNDHKFYLDYYPDPIYHEFVAVKTVYLDDGLLRMSGENLITLYHTDIVVSEDYKVPCSILDDKNFDSITCEIMRHDRLFVENQIHHSVNISVGNIRFRLVFFDE